MAAAALSGQSPAAASTGCCTSNAGQSTVAYLDVDRERLLPPEVIGCTRPIAFLHFAEIAAGQRSLTVGAEPPDVGSIWPVLVVLTACRSAKGRTLLLMPIGRL